MEKITSHLKEKLNLLPSSPGVYLMKDQKGEVIYVGKALNLKNRIRSYFSGKVSDEDSYQTKITQMVSQITDLEYIITPSEQEAFLLEANLIKKYRPRYNVSLKDDKQYPFIKITLHEPFPRVMLDRERAKDGSKYFGPYSDATAVRRTLRTIEWLMPLRTCKRNIPAGEPIYQKPCLNYQLGKCSAPCIGKISQAEYGKLIDYVISFLQGKNREIINSLHQEMIELSSKMQFEKAARIRDQISMFEKLQKSQHIFFHDEENRDVITPYKEEKLAVVTVLKILSGKLLNKENYRLENAEDASSAEILAAFINQYYADKMNTLPHKILLSEEPQDYESLNRWLHNRLHIPQRGDNRQLIAIAQKNAFNFMETIKLSHLRKASRTVFPIQELKEKLGLSKLPRKMICLDISTIQGSDTVSSIVYFENGKPLKREYRHFRIASLQGQDDYAAIRETLSRYLKKMTDENRPDLIIIDGGKGQLNAALAELKEYTEIAMISLAKRLEEIYLPHKSEPIFLPRSSSALRLLVTIRDEAHRFAINYHRKKRSQRTIQSDLDQIKGIGKDKKFLLLKHFGSVENIKKASEQEVMEVKGIGEKTAKMVKDGLDKSDH
ncbi:MAG: excinuclease ABC subunit UvrC [Candidatus Cloacimonetes bacterium]|nr:excinuclease ABC subunit UvrC [Candidatus Cloacimonadota bacterium]